MFVCMHPHADMRNSTTFYYFLIFFEIIFTRFIDDVIFMMLILQFWSLFVAFLIQFFPLTYSYKKYTCAWLMYSLTRGLFVYMLFRKKWERSDENAREKKTNLIIFILFEFHSVLKSLPAKRIEREQKSIFFFVY